MKKTFRGVAAALVCALLICALAGCGATIPAPSLPTAEVTIPTPRLPSPVAAGHGTAALPEVWHADEAFSDMTAQPYDLAQFEALTAPMYYFAEKGGTDGAFNALCQDLWNELNYVYTQYTLADLAYSRNPSDKALADADDDAWDVYSDANDEYWAAMHAVAVSDYAYLLDGSFYASWQADQFASYSGKNDAQNTLSDRESALEKEYYTEIAARWPDTERIAEIYIELLGIRGELARGAGYGSFAEYCYDNYYFREYTPEDAQELWALTKKYFVPLVERYGDEVNEASLDVYWSDRIDCSAAALLDAMATVLSQISTELSDVLDYMLDYGLYDIGGDSVRMDTGYTTLLYSSNEPFIFAKLGGNYYDYTTMFHEFGHFTNYWCTRSDLLFGLPDNDTAELQSQGLELLALFFYGELFGAEDGKAIADDLLMNVIYSVIDGCMYDEFQQLAYAETALTPDRLQELYAQVLGDYGYDADEDDYFWMHVEHNFSYPFYYISYAVSAVPALELFALATEDFDAAAEAYITAVSVDTEQYYFSDALGLAGLADPFDTSASRSVADAVAEYLAK